MRDVGYVQKRGYNDFHKYSYVTEADILEALRDKMVEHGLVVIPSAQVHSNEDGLVLLDMEFTVGDTETGDFAQFKWVGSGHDKGDKGVYKAFTGAQKYFLMKTFLMPTGDDPESFSDTDKATSGTATNGNSSSQVSSNSSSESLACERCGQEVRGSAKYTAEQRAVFIRRANDGRLICKNCGGG
jgi:hypothetical protein